MISKVMEEVRFLRTCADEFYRHETAFEVESDLATYVLQEEQPLINLIMGSVDTRIIVELRGDEQALLKSGLSKMYERTFEGDLRNVDWLDITDFLLEVYQLTGDREWEHLHALVDIRGSINFAYDVSDGDLLNHTRGQVNKLVEYVHERAMRAMTDVEVNNWMEFKQGFKRER